jgi:hypothetical protein
MSGMELARARALARQPRATNRLVTQYESATQARLAAIDHETEVAIGKLDSLTVVTREAASRLLGFNLGQKAVEQLAPELSAELATLAAVQHLGMHAVMTDLGFQLRRL